MRRGTDALAADARDELGISRQLAACPLQAAYSHGGASLPNMVGPALSGASLICLAERELERVDVQSLQVSG